jgi:surfactin family lipopeptide synthetase A
MVPYPFIEVEYFPLPPNKKVDRKILSQREIIKTGNQNKHQHPKTELQRQLIGYWKDVLNYEGKMSITDDFFFLGGHSLNAVKLIHLINSELQYSINLKTLFDFSTIISLSNYLTTIESKKTQSIPISIKKEYYTITPSQYEIWLASQNVNKSIANNMVAAFHVNGIIDTNKINKAINQLLLEHEILRTNFIEIKGGVYQKVNEIGKINFNILIKQVKENEVLESLKNFINQEFNLEHDLLLKMQLLQIDTSTAILVFCAHHIILDGCSLERFTYDFLHYYSNDIENTVLNKETIQFKDYSEWIMSSTEIQKGNNFWKDYLEDYKIKESFTPDVFINEGNNNGSHFNFQLNIEETNALKTFLRKQKATIHSFLIAALNILIFKSSKHDDIIIGTVNSGRDKIELTNMLGMFVKTLPLRTKISKELNFKTVLESVNRSVLAIDQNQNIPTEYRNEMLYDVLIVFQNPDFTHQDTIKLENVELTTYPIDVDSIKLPLLFDFYEKDDIISAILSYDTEKYSEETIQLIVLKYKKLINKIILNPLIQIDDLDIMLDLEKQKTIDIDFNF